MQWCTEPALTRQSSRLVTLAADFRVKAMIEPIRETKYPINITSPDDKESLKEIFKKDLTL